MDEDRTNRPGYGSYGDWEWDDDHPLVNIHDLPHADFVDPSTEAPPLYDGRPIRAPDERGGYRRALDDTWDAARQAYLNGEAVNLICARHSLARSSFYARGRAEGWLHQARGAPEPVDLDAEIEAGLPDYGDMARQALVRLNRAIEAGRGAEAAVWMRLHTKLLALAMPPNPPPNPPPLGEVAAQPTEGALSTPPPPSPKPKPAPKPLDPLDLAIEQARLAGTLARSADDLMTLGDDGRQLIEKGMEALAFMSSLLVSDGSDVSDTVFSADRDASAPASQVAPEGPP